MSWRHNSISALTWLPVVGMLLLASGCGFHPMYGDHSALAEESPLSGNLVIAPIPGREGQIFRNALEDRLNPEGISFAHPEYMLKVSMDKNLIPAVIKADGTIQRYDVQFMTNFSLIRIAGNKTLLTSTLSRTGSYNVTINANFATYEAEQDVIDRTLQEIAEDYLLRITSYFAGKKTSAG